MNVLTPYPGASWNLDVRDIGEDVEHADRAMVLERWGGGPTAPTGYWRMAFNEYAVCQYDAALLLASGQRNPMAPTKVRRLFQAVWAQKLYGAGGQIYGAKVGDWLPWSDKWVAPPGNDRIVIIRNLPKVKLDDKGRVVKDSTGRPVFTWEGGDTTSTSRTLVLKQSWDLVWNAYDLLEGGMNIRAGLTSTDHEAVMVVGSGGIQVGDFGIAWEQNASRGSGLNKLVGQVTAEAVLDAQGGPLETAMNLTIANTMFAPRATKADGILGTEGEHFLGPALRCEWATEDVPTRWGRGNEADIDPSHQSMHGLRTYLHPEFDAEAAAYQAVARLCRKLGLPMPTMLGMESSPLYRTTLTLLTTAMVRGRIVLETSAYGMHTETDGPSARELWRKAGVAKLEHRAYQEILFGAALPEDWRVALPTIPGGRGLYPRPGQ